jgi:hypothetical protein
MKSSAEMRRRKPPHTGEWVCKDRCEKRKPAGQIVLGETRVEIPGVGQGVAVELRKREVGRGHRTTKLPPTVIVQLDDGRRVGRVWAHLKAAS